jgi:PAS domain S-box-containing protein
MVAMSTRTSVLPAAAGSSTSNAEPILAAVVFGAQQFMHSSGWSARLEGWLERLGRATAVTQVRVFENDALTAGEPVRSSMKAQWLAPGTRAGSLDGMQHLSFPELGCERWEVLLSMGQAVVGNREDFRTSERPIMEQQGIQSVAIVPVFAGARWWGFLEFGDRERRRTWHDTELHALFAAAETLGAVLSREEMAQRIAAAAAQEKLAAEIGNVLTSTARGLDEVLHLCIDRIAHYLPADLVCIWTVERDGSTLRACLAASSRGVDVQPADAMLGVHAIGRIALTNRAMTWHSELPELWPGSVPALRSAGLNDGAAHPLSVDGRVVGVVAVLHATPLTAAARDALSSVTDELSLAIERSDAQTALYLTEIRYRRLVEATLEGVCIHDGVRIRDGNPSIAAMVGYEVNDIIGRSPLDFIHPDNHAEVIRNIATNYTAPYEALLLRRDGTVLPVEITGRDFIHDGEKLRVTTVRDLTERKEAERTAQKLAEERDARAWAERRRGHAEFLADASRILASSFDTTTTLNQLAHLCVRSVADFCVVSLVREHALEQVAVVHADMAKTELLTRAVTLWHEYWRSDHPLTRRQRSGESFITELSDHDLAELAPQAELRTLLERLQIRTLMSAPISSAGELIGSIIVSAGTDRARYAEEELATLEELGRRAALALQSAQSYHDARAATQARDELLAVVAHDLRNPLNVIHMGSTLALDMISEPAAPGRRQLEIIQRAAEHMNRLIQDLLDATRLQSGQLALDVAPTRVRLIVNEAMDLLRPLAQHAGITLEAVVPDDLPAVAADRGRVQQVLSNLVGNALKFTPRGGRVCVAACAHPLGVRFAVTDTGPGIPAEQLPQIFGRFWQALRTDRRGLGLGLAIARGIVEAHGGEIGVASREGEGSTFSFTLPRSD